MKRVFALILCVIMVMLPFSGCGSSTEETQPFSVGFAQANITPSGSVLLGGFFDPQERFSNEVLDPIYATCVAFTDEVGTTVLMFCMDLLNTDGALFTPLREQISEATGVPASNILVTSSHTHSAPHQNYSANVGSNTYIMENCMIIAKKALEDRKPAKMYTTFARPDGMNFVRHYVLADGSYLGKRTGFVPADQLVGHVHKADNLLQLVKFEREGGKPVILTNWQAHYKGATSVNYNGISSDYPGIYRAALEQTLDCHAAFILGGSGNLTSSSKIDGLTTTADYLEHGKKLAQIAAEAAANFQPAETGKIYINENLYETTGNDGTTKTLPLYAFGFGDFGCAFSPFEIFDTNAKAVREASKWTYTFYASCSSDGSGNGYLPDADGFTYRTYEAYGQDEVDYMYTKFPKGTAETIQEILTNMLNSIFDESGNTQKQRESGYMSEEYVPVTDGVEYTNPKPGDPSLIKEGVGDRGLYCFQMLAPTGLKNMLAASKEIADEVVNKTTMKFIFDERNVIVGFAE